MSFSEDDCDSYDSGYNTQDSEITFGCNCGCCRQCKDDPEDEDCEGCPLCLSIAPCIQYLIDTDRKIRYRPVEIREDGFLDISDDEYSVYKLPKLPKDLKKLNVRGKRLRKLPNRLPKHLQELTLFRCTRLQKIPILPDSLEFLNCTGLNMTTLPNIPKNLKTLQCDDSKLELKELPESLLYLSCSKTNLTKETKFPKNLKRLELTGYENIPIPVFPDSLEELILDKTSIIQFPDLPKNLRFLKIERFVQCLDIPEIPETLSCFKCLADISFIFERDDKSIKIQDKIRRINQYFGMKRITKN